ncbi:MAG: DPP IV N-terminal domain-containing protein [Flavobacteriales bacterium]|nr:DPP IV N-terminal domain-containing protein [Flavobacteriales bacterium]
MKFIFSILLSAVYLLSFAQKPFTLDDAILGGYAKFRLKSPSQLGWVPNEDRFCWVTEDSLNPSLVKKALLSTDTTVICSLSDLKKFDQLSELNRFPRFEWSSPTTLRFRNKTTMMSYNINTKKIDVLFEVNEKGENMDIFDDKTFAYTVDNNLVIWKNGIEHQVTSEKDKGVICGQSVHRFEFGIYKGTFWSNSGKTLAFYRKDETMVTDYPLANYTSRPAESNIIKYPMAGMPSHQVTVGIYNLETKQTLFLKTGEAREQYLTNIAWGPKDEFIYVALLNRDQNHMKLNQYDAKTGELVKTLFEEKHDKYVQPLHPMQFLPNEKDQDKFIWQSERDGYNHLYLYNTKGKLIKQITKGKWVVTEVNCIHKNGNIYITTTENDGMDRLGYMYNAYSDRSGPIAIEYGTHNIKMNDAGTQFIDIFSKSDQPISFSVRATESKKKETLLTNVNPYAEYAFSMPELGKLDAEDGSKLNYRIIKPFDFDPNKKYKCLVYVYQGPGVQLITNSWLAGASPWMQYQANKGYVIFTIDGRGTENRGRDFEQVTFRKLGEIEMVDQLKGVEYLRSLPYIDATKMAVHGWSYGGFMTTSLMLRAPGVFNVGVAGGPVIDWKYYEIMYTERYMDTPEANESGYAQASLLNKVDQLKGKLMIIHGADDDVVVPQHSIDFLKQSVDKGVQVDFFLYPGHKHNVGGKDRVHLMQKVLDYIDEKID